MAETVGGWMGDISCREVVNLWGPKASAEPERSETERSVYLMAATDSQSRGRRSSEIDTVR